MLKHVTLFVTARCNSACKTCFYWRRLNGPGPEMSIDEITTLAPQLRGVVWLAITGGEPFLRSDLADILRIMVADARPAYLTLATNGSFPDRIGPTLLPVLTARRRLPVTVSVSLDGLGKLHDSLRGLEGGFDKACGSIKELRRLQAGYPGLRLRVCTCYNALNQDTIEEIPAFLRKEFGEVAWDFSLVRGTPREPAAAEGVDIRRYFQLKRKYLPAFAGASGGSLAGMIASAKNRMVARVQEQVVCGKAKAVPRCRAGSVSAVIRENGEVIACETGEEKYRLGSLREGLSLDAVMRSGPAEAARKQIRDSRCMCGHECNLTSNLIFSFPSLIKAAL
jgi:MoaA/NifB/PqqE/SkfB family radical SAM enzyme